MSYNTSCCNEYGVPEKCIGLCENENFRRIPSPTSICDKWKKKISECIITTSGNVINSRIISRNLYYIVCARK